MGVRRMYIPPQARADTGIHVEALACLMSKPEGSVASFLDSLKPFGPKPKP